MASFCPGLLHPGGCEMKNISLIARICCCVCVCNPISLATLPFNVVWCRKRLHDDALLKEEDRHVWPELSGSPCSLEHDSFHSDPGVAWECKSFWEFWKIILGCTNVHKRSFRQLSYKQKCWDETENVHHDHNENVPLMKIRKK